MNKGIYAERRAIIDTARDVPGGWSRSVLESFGVPWPPPRGWYTQLVMEGFPYKTPDEKPGESWFGKV